MTAKVVLVLGAGVLGVVSFALGQQRAGDMLVGGAVSALMFLLGNKANGDNGGKSHGR